MFRSSFRIKEGMVGIPRVVLALSFPYWLSGHSRFIIATYDAGSTHVPRASPSSQHPRTRNRQSGRPTTVADENEPLCDGGAVVYRDPRLADGHADATAGVGGRRRADRQPARHAAAQPPRTRGRVRRRIDVDAFGQGKVNCSRRRIRTNGRHGGRRPLFVVRSIRPTSAPSTGTRSVLSDIAVPPEKCGICFELTPLVSRFPPAECGHVFCVMCMRQHLIVIATDTHEYPFPCPGCRGVGNPGLLDPQTCLNVLAGTGRPYIELQKLLLERQHVQRLCYCANKACSMPFDFQVTPNAEAADNASQVTCPMCKTDTCVDCKVPWHQGRTCAQFRDEQSGEGLLHKLAKQKRWTSCPKCMAHIDRQERNCNFVKCRCGSGFCHNCGKEYLSLKPTGINQHMLPACTCGLFGDENMGEAAAPPANIDLAEAYREQIFNYFEREVRPRREIIEEDSDSDDSAAAPLESMRIGAADLDHWINEDAHRMPGRMLEHLRENQCPYAECHREFGSLRALEQHLDMTEQHEVFLCCGRPFGDRHGLNQHHDAVHR